MRRAAVLAIAMLGCSRASTEPVLTHAPLPPSDVVASPPVATSAAGTADSAPAPAATDSALATSGELDPRFAPLLAAAFRDYKAWGRWDDEMRWAPWLCRMPLPGRARMSDAEDGSHARKLYSIFVKNRATYGYQPAMAKLEQPVGQVVVKQSFHAVRIDASEKPMTALQDQPLGTKDDHFYPYAREGEHLYRTGELAGIYVMTRLAPETSGTDSGWVYGTVTPDGQVTSAGRVASCMGCHVDAGPGRLFGAAVKRDAY
jgi:hypothetical protein